MLDWLYTSIAWLLQLWHALLATFLDPAGGPAWALAIVLLVVTVRLLLLPLFLAQLRSQRAAQALQPEITALRARYGSDTRALGQAILALRRERGVKPLAGCLPALLQAPVFLALLHVLRRLAPGKPGLYSWSYDLTQQAANATLAGAPISGSLHAPGAGTSTRLVAVLLVAALCLTSFLTQRQLQRRSGPVTGQAATVQRALRYGMPLSLLLSGPFFPIGVLLYWTVNNLWTLGQQVLTPPRPNPAGSPAVAGRPAPVGRTLAPRPGARPVRPGRRPDRRSR